MAQTVNVYPMINVCNLANYANMLIIKVAQGCNFVNSAEISLITIMNTNQSKNLVLINISRSCTQHMGPSTRLYIISSKINMLHTNLDYETIVRYLVHYSACALIVWY